MNMKTTIQIGNTTVGTASAQLLSNNIEVYENTVPALVSDRLRNPKFAGPANPQTGVAPEWEPCGNGMQGLICQLVPGMYLSGTESQLVQHYAENGWAGILQVGVPVFAGEELEIEIWARARHRPVTVRCELQLPGQTAFATPTLLFDVAHWTRRAVRVTGPATDATVYFKILIPGDSVIYIDQVHLRPVGQPNVNLELSASFDRFPCPVLRFPGGCASCTYHWENGIGPVHRRPVQDDPVFKYKMYYEFGTDEYLELCAAKNIRPQITLNSTSATPEDAAGWATYIRNWYIRRNLKVPAAYFAVGNENYGPWEIGHMTGEMYVAQLREFVPAVRAAYPEARIMALGEAQARGMRTQYTTPWRATVLAQAADLFDVLVVTRYSWGTDHKSLEEIMPAVAKAVAGKEADLQQMAQDIRATGLPKTLGVVEWNLWTRASHNDHAGFFEPNDIRHCLYAAGLLNIFCRLGEILEIANYYALIIPMGMLHMKNGHVTFSDVVKVFNLYAPALPGEVLATTVAVPKLVDALFLRSAGQTYGFLVNFNHDQPAEVAVTGSGPIREAVGLTASQILEPVQEIAVAVKGTTVVVPPMSLIRVKL